MRGRTQERLIEGCGSERMSGRAKVIGVMQMQPLIEGTATADKAAEWAARVGMLLLGICAKIDSMNISAWEWATNLTQDQDTLAREVATAGWSVTLSLETSGTWPLMAHRCSNATCDASL